MSKPLTDSQAETEWVRAIQDKQAPRYDRQISSWGIVERTVARKPRR